MTQEKLDIEELSNAIETALRLRASLPAQTQPAIEAGLRAGAQLLCEVDELRAQLKTTIDERDTALAETERRARDLTIGDVYQVCETEGSAAVAVEAPVSLVVTVYVPYRSGLWWRVIERTTFPNGLHGRAIKPFEFFRGRIFWRYQSAAKFATKMTEWKNGEKK